GGGTCGGRRSRRVDKVPIGDRDRLALALRHLDEDVDDLLPARTVGAGELVEIDDEVDVLRDQRLVAAGEQLVARKRHVAELADPYHVLDAAALEELVPERRPVLRQDQIGVAGEELERLVEVA